MYISQELRNRLKLWKETVVDKKVVLTPEQKAMLTTNSEEEMESMVRVHVHLLSYSRIFEGVDGEAGIWIQQRTDDGGIKLYRALNEEDYNKTLSNIEKMDVSEDIKEGLRNMVFVEGIYVNDWKWDVVADTLSKED